MKNNKLNKIFNIISAGLFVSLLNPTASAQTSDEAQATDEDEIPILSTFEVLTDAVSGYATTSSHVGSRIAVPITDLASSVITLNAEILEDVIASDLHDALGYVSGASPLGYTDTVNYTLRGFTASGSQRDGIPEVAAVGGTTSGGGFDFITTERLEVIKGPQGVLYGTTSIGGVLNRVTKKPRVEPLTSVSFQVGSWDNYRATLDTSGWIDKNKKFGYRLNAAYQIGDGSGNVETVTDVGDNDRWVINPVFTYRTELGNEFMFYFSFMEDGEIVPDSVQGFLGPDGDIIPHWGMKNDTFSFWPVRDRRSKINNYEIRYTHALEFFGADSIIRIGARFTQIDRTQQDVSIRGHYTYTDAQGNLIAAANPNTIPYELVDTELAKVTRPQLRFSDSSTISDNSLVFFDMNNKFKLGPTSSDLLFSLQAGVSESSRHRFRQETDPLTTLGQEPYEIWPNTNSNGFTLNQIVNDLLSPNRVRFDTLVYDEDNFFNAAVLERLSLFEGKLILVGGARYDRRRGSNNPDFNNPDRVPDRQDVDETTYRLGFVIKPVEGLSIFYQKSQTFRPEFLIDVRPDTFGERFPNHLGEMDEVGAKLNLFKNRIVATFSYFESEETNNILQIWNQAENQTFREPAGSQFVQGFEFDAAIRPLPGLDLLLSFSTLTSQVERTEGSQENQRIVLVDGPQIPDETFSVLANYRFQEGEWLQNLGFNIGYRHVGSRLFRISEIWSLDAYDVVDAGFSYQWSKIRFDFRVMNLFDSRYVVHSTFPTNMRVGADRNFRFRISYSF